MGKLLITNYTIDALAAFLGEIDYTFGASLSDEEKHDLAQRFMDRMTKIHDIRFGIRLLPALEKPVDIDKVSQSLLEVAKLGNKTALQAMSMSECSEMFAKVFVDNLLKDGE